jgi:SAM-dependent methyltransferase
MIRDLKAESRNYFNKLAPRYDQHYYGRHGHEQYQRVLAAAMGWKFASVQAFAEMHRVLKKGGHAVIADVTIPAPFRHLSNWIAQFGKEGDVKVYSAGELELMLREAGLVDTRVEHLSFMAVVVSARASK